MSVDHPPLFLHTSTLDHWRNSAGGGGAPPHPPLHWSKFWEQLNNLQGTHQTSIQKLWSLSPHCSVCYKCRLSKWRTLYVFRNVFYVKSFVPRAQFPNLLSFLIISSFFSLSLCFSSYSLYSVRQSDFFRLPHFSNSSFFLPICKFFFFSSHLQTFFSI